MDASITQVKGAKDTTDELIQNVIDTIDNASTQKLGLSVQLNSLQQAKQQVQQSAKIASEEISRHFDELQKALIESINERKNELLEEIKRVENMNMEPLQECEEMINMSLTDATTCLEQGRNVLANGPEKNLDALVNFKDSTKSKDLNILPEVPNLGDVAFLCVDFHVGLTDRLQELIHIEGKIYDRAPVQICDIIERPGALLVKWAEVDEDVDVAEFCLQYCYGQTTALDCGKSTFHTVYCGPETSYLVRRLRPNASYSFRVKCRSDDEWSVWSVPKVASTSINHYEWDDTTDGYSVSNENKIGTREEGLTRVLYSKSPCYKSGFSLSFRILDSGEKSPIDGVGLAVTNEDIDTLKREGAVFLACDGKVYIDGQEMKTRLPCLSRNSIVNIQTESLHNGKIRVCIQVQDKELTFDWNIERQVALGMIGGLGMMPLAESTQCFFFAMIFSHEDWKVSVE
ncbi:Cytokine receptor-like factor 3 [Mactra antiquata]